MTSKIYVANPGVDWVNGKRVPANRELALTEAEAKFDLAHGRIEPKPAPKTRAAAKPKPDGEQSDEV